MEAGVGYHGRYRSVPVTVKQCDATATKWVIRPPVLDATAPGAVV